MHILHENDPANVQGLCSFIRDKLHRPFFGSFKTKRGKSEFGCLSNLEIEINSQDITVRAVDYDMEFEMRFTTITSWKRSEHELLINIKDQTNKITW